jgi:hypothetical protein
MTHAGEFCAVAAVRLYPSISAQGSSLRVLFPVVELKLPGGLVPRSGNGGVDVERT